MLVGGRACGLHQPAVSPSLFAVWWVRDELEMSDGLPVRAKQLWVTVGLPQGLPDGSYFSLAPRQVLKFMNLCCTHISYCSGKANLQTYVKKLYLN